MTRRSSQRKGLSGRVGTISLVYIAMALFCLVASQWLETPIMIGVAMGIAASGMMLLWRSGLISFGHGLYLGIGAYSVAILADWGGVTSILVALLVGGICAAGVGVFVGLLVRRYRGIFFAMLNLAFSMVLYGYLVNSTLFGSTEGLSVPPGHLFGLAMMGSGGGERELVFIVLGIGFCVSVFIEMWRHSVMGWLNQGIRDNEVRIRYLGYSVRGVVFWTYMVSVITTAWAGVLLAFAVGQVDPNSLVNWTASGGLVFATVLGGTGSALAPLLGGISYEAIRSVALDMFPESWGLVMGVAIVLIVMVFPDGLWSVGARGIRGVRALRSKVFS